jgi:hypothetical protein
MFYVERPLTLEEALSNSLRNSPQILNKIKSGSNSTKLSFEKILESEIDSILKNAKTISIKTFNNKFVCADKGLNNIVVANRDVNREWETFTLYKLSENTCALSSSSGNFFSADLGSKTDLTANRVQIAEWETFTIVDLKNGFVALKAANGKYITIDDSSKQLFARANDIGEKEKFKIIYK